MKEQFEDVHAVAEERHPWFVARRALFTELADLDRDARILDIGCGTGMFLVHLKSLGFRNLAGVETSERMRQRFRDDAIPLYELGFTEALLPVVRWLRHPTGRRVLYDLLDDIFDARQKLPFDLQLVGRSYHGNMAAEEIEKLSGHMGWGRRLVQ